MQILYPFVSFTDNGIKFFGYYMVSVSVLMPVFNVEEYISETLDSILSQSSIDFELVIIDDASTDNTVSVVDRYRSIDSRIKFIKNERNLGISGALNKGLAVCTGEYIARVDGDDLMSPERLIKQYDFLEKNRDHALVGCWVKNINVNGDIIAECKYPCDHAAITSMLQWTSPVLHIWMARKSVYDSLGGYRNTNPAEDYDFLLRCIAKGLKVANIPFYGAFIRLRQGNTLSVASLKQRKAFNYLYSLYKLGAINNSNHMDLNEVDELKVTYLMNRIHLLSSKFLSAGFERRNSYKKYVYFFLSLISPYTIQDIYRRLMFKRALRKYRGEE
ncbi:glycosyltransferase family 2 protein [Aeromonas sp. A-5]|uniref:glycosyltransferase family 2 protein n=1 Tax=Aeromonas ichthyocola TaxID=3367746 RepID=UPI0038F24BB7